MFLLWQAHSIITILRVFQDSGFLVAPSLLEPVWPGLESVKLAPSLRRLCNTRVMLGLVQGIRLLLAWFCFGFSIVRLRFGQGIGVRSLHAGAGSLTTGASKDSSPACGVHSIAGRPPCGSAPGGA